ncbi:hypothetical protein A2631_00220 [Candidatus Daviesbacteria bacterium RIFCSPHIGHO2_01_FULL_44_29]|nr:MAG: hypothetical protein A2631_00220 [Candidatus Daviesbacteria bacterium RIFCSPHIGHO2_01_FULL_44_29]
MKTEKKELKQQTNKYIFIDESGILSDPKDSVIIIAAVSSSLPEQLIEVTTQTRKQLRNRKIDLQEIKFYRSGENTRKIFLTELVQKDIELFTLTVKKKGQRIDDTPENFAFLCWLLLEECMLFYNKTIREIVFDKHFHRKIDRDAFDSELHKLSGLILHFKHADSIQDVRVNVADMVAGSTLWYQTGKDSKYYKIIEDKIISEKVFHWKKARKTFFDVKK